MAARRNLNRRAVHGFTLLEAMVALVIFGIVSFALSMALSTAFQAQSASQRRQDEAGGVRAIFGSLTRDLQSAFASANNSASVFIAGSGQQGRSASSGSDSLLTLSTRSYRIQGAEGSDPAGSLMGEGGQPSANDTAPPQSDVAIVRYDFNPAEGTLMRTVSAVPNLQAVAQSASTPDTILAKRILSITLRFWDTTNKTWREDWDFEQQNQSSQDDQNGQGGGNGGNGGAGNNGSPGLGRAQSDASSGDFTLPGAVEVTLTLKNSDGEPVTYTTQIPILAPQMLPKPTSAPTNTNNTNQPGANNTTNQPGNNTNPNGNPQNTGGGNG